MRNFTIRDTVKRIREKYRHEIVYADSIQEMETYINEHPGIDKIGFLLKASDPCFVHYYPLFFERKNNIEHFIQFDSQGDFYALPEKRGVERRQYYSPFQRQADLGCAEDGLKILVKCFEEADMLAFSQAFSTEDKEIIAPISSAERDRHEEVRVKKHLSDDEKVFLRCYRRREKYEKFCKASTDCLPIELIYQFTTMPARFLVHIERYDTMRFFQNSEPDKFAMPYKSGETVSEHIMRKGVLRRNEDRTLPPEKETDQKGQSFMERKIRYKQKLYTPDISKDQMSAVLDARRLFTQANSTWEIDHSIEELIKSEAFVGDLWREQRPLQTLIQELLLNGEQVSPEKIKLLAEKGADFTDALVIGMQECQIGCIATLCEYITIADDARVVSETKKEELFFALTVYCGKCLVHPIPLDKKAAALKVILNYYPVFLNYHYTDNWTLLAALLNAYEALQETGKNPSLESLVAFTKLLLDLGAATDVTVIGSHKTALEIAQEIDAVTPSDAEKIAPLIEEARKKDVAAPTRSR